MKHRISVTVFLIAFTLALFLQNWLDAALLCVAFLGITAWGVFDIRIGYFLPTMISKKNPGEKIVALTFDDGPTEFTPYVLKLLEKYDFKATFFCIGKNAETNPDIFRQIISARHEVGNHSYSHKNNTGFLSAKQMTDEISRTDSVFKEFFVHSQLYRPPFGVTNPNIAKAISLTQKKCIGWNIRSLDTVIGDEQKIAQRIIRKLRPGSIILMHDTSEKSVKALGILLLHLRRENYKTLTVSQLLNLK